MLSNGSTCPATPRESAAAGVAWQVFAQASVVQDMSGPDLEAAVAALDDAGKTATHAGVWANSQNAGKPPGGHASWTDWLRAVTVGLYTFNAVDP